MERKICVIGMWHLGCVTAACLSRLGFKVTCFDFDKEVIEKLKEGKLPVYELGLEEMFTESKSKGMLHSTADIESAIKDADFVYIAFDTPIDEKDQTDLTVIDKTIDEIIPLLAEESIIIISSQIPVGTSDSILKKLRDAGKDNELCYVPENLRLGNAISCFMKPGRIIFGLSSDLIKERIEGLFSVIEARHIFMDLKSAEMSKHALNAYLASMISFSGEISDLCEKTGANAIKVMNALKTDKRVSEFAPILPGLGFGGGTLARDVQILRRLGKKNRVKTEVLDAVISANNSRMKYVANKLQSVLGSLDKKKIAFIGLVYKVGTSTLRRSLALQVIDQLGGKGLVITAYDPMIKEPIKGYAHIEICKSAEEAAKGADAVVITTDWDEFKGIDYSKIAKYMRNPVLIDTKNMLDPNEFRNTGIKYYGVGIVNERA